MAIHSRTVRNRHICWYKASQTFPEQQADSPPQAGEALLVSSSSPLENELVGKHPLVRRIAFQRWLRVDNPLKNMQIAYNTVRGPFLSFNYMHIFFYFRRTLKYFASLSFWLWFSLNHINYSRPCALHINIWSQKCWILSFLIFWILAHVFNMLY